VSYTAGADGAGEVVRDLGSTPWWTRALARRLAAREARALARLRGVPDVPALRSWDGCRLVRSWLEGAPLHVVGTRDPAYFRAALTLLRRLHRAGVAHGDLAKEPNWLVLADGRPALVDFQIATVSRRRGCWFRTRAREDVRHLLKHKRSYCPERLTTRQRRMLATPAWPSRVWMATGKRVYLFVTRRLLGWADREGAGDRRFSRRR
jgi:RIO-like serine/threonine protein kinase